MSVARLHADWLALLDISGPFLSLQILQEVFPHGPSGIDPSLYKNLRNAFHEWEAEIENPSPNPAIHRAWIEFVLLNALELPEGGLFKDQDIQNIQCKILEEGITLRPHWALIELPTEAPNMLIQYYPHDQALEKEVKGDRWKTSPARRMLELLHYVDCPLGLVTNGEEWMLIHAKRGETTSYISWYAHLWFEEKNTLQAFIDLLGEQRFFNAPDDKTLPKLFEASAKDQQEVTDQLGKQVRRSVEMLVQTIDRINRESNNELLNDVDELELYNSALTFMMRLVFMFCAEERKLFPLDDGLYSGNYAVSTLCQNLQETADLHGEEILERRKDAWHRLLAVFRAVHGGIQNDRLPMIAYGGNLFDPDRYPFLEGRRPGTSWHDTQAQPLPVDNRTVLHLLRSLQYLTIKIKGIPAESRRISFRALDIEQIGHVYEGLLDHTAVRASSVVVSLKGKEGDEPEVSLDALEEHRAKGDEELIPFIQSLTGRTPKAIQKDFEKEPDSQQQNKLHAICEGDEDTFQRVLPYAGLIRLDHYGNPVVFLPGSIYVTQGTDRRSTGTHYTPRALTEPIVQYTLEPLLYPDIPDGKDKADSRHLSVNEVLELKICDMAMGSGAFLVQTCRYLGDYILQQWADAEEEAKTAGNTAHLTYPYANPETGELSEQLLPAELEERRILAYRLVASKCLYGVDKNPMAVEMAKLSLWLITMDQRRPFTFIDHCLKCGDSLLGLHTKQQVDYIHIAPEKYIGKESEMAQYLWFSTDAARDAFDIAIKKRMELESFPVTDIRDSQRKAVLLKEADEATDLVRLVGDLVVGAAIATADGNSQKRNGEAHKDFLHEQRVIHEHVDHVLDAKDGEERQRNIDTLYAIADDLLHKKSGDGVPKRKPFHWVVEFPEVFQRKEKGFDAIVGNPPFMGGQKITGALGTDYRNYLVDFLAGGQRGSADICAYFFLQANDLMNHNGGFGLLATNTIAQGDTREVGMDQLVDKGCIIPRAVSSRKWPGEASLEVAHVWLRRSGWKNDYNLNDNKVSGITSFLTKPGVATGKPHRLAANADKSFQGSIVLGMGFVLTPDEAQALIEKDPKNRDVLFPYLNGEDLNSRPDQSPSRWVINFFDWPLNWDDAPEDWDGPVAEDYPDCLKIVNESVKPEREKIKYSKNAREKWWIYERLRIELYDSITTLKKVLSISTQATKYVAFSLVDPKIVFSNATAVIATDLFEEFCVINNSIHNKWVENYTSLLETRIRYTPSDCFETFPFPTSLEGLEDIGERYYTHRQSIMTERQEGLTKTYNRFHNPNEKAEDIAQLRSLHVEMDYAVAKAYGWDDLDLGHGFHETPQGIRYTLHEDTRQEVLDRLLTLNHERYEEEVKQGLHDKKKKGGKAKTKRKTAVKKTSQPMGLLGE